MGHTVVLPWHGRHSRGSVTQHPIARQVCIVLLAVITSTGCTGWHQSLNVVGVPVADLRAKPGPLATAAAHDPLQETQLLYGERVALIKTEGGWAFIEAIEQPEYTHHHRWQGYPGWVRQESLQSLSPRAGTPNAIIRTRWATVWHDEHRTTPQVRLPMGTKIVLTSTVGELLPLTLVNGSTGWIAKDDVSLISQLSRLSEDARRHAILRAAEQFLGDPYFWGGRSPHLDSTTASVTGVAPPPVAAPKAHHPADGGMATGGGATGSGVDCSGLVNLAYRTAGLEVPRDAHEQYLRARKISVPKPADLIFLSATDKPHTIVHVMLYAGDGWVIEGPGTGLSIRRIPLAKRFGRPLKQLHAGDRIDHQTLFFGTYFP